MNNKWNLMKLKKFFEAKDTTNRTKQQSTEWEKIFTNPASNRGLIIQIHKELKELDINKSSKPIEKLRKAENSQQRNLRWPRPLNVQHL